MPCKQTDVTIWTKGTANWVKWRETTVAEGQQLCSTCYAWVAQHVIRVWIGSGAQDRESMVGQGIVKHGFKVLLHSVVDDPLQALHCLVLQSLNEPRSFIPSIPVDFGP